VPGSPNAAATSPMTAVTLNCAMPAATDSTDTASTGAVSHAGRRAPAGAATPAPREDGDADATRVRVMRLVTWNVNSVRARLPRVRELLLAHAPDVLCVQETKVAAEAFPHDDLAELGYRAVAHSEGRWNGVALVVRDGLEIEDVRAGLPGEPSPDQARWIEAVVDGVRVASTYVPNGRDPTHAMFVEKLGFLDAMCAHVGASLASGPVVVAGDFNVAPADLDVWDPEALEGSTHVTPAERERIAALGALGLTDAFRALHPDDTGFTWWDYRMGAFRRGMGMRIDLVLVGPDLEPVAATVDTVFRRNNEAGDKPSDHAPLIVELARGR
jgi:exodeoxyribonuclease III